VLVIGEGKLRGDFVNRGLSQETVLAAAIDQSSQYLASRQPVAAASETGNNGKLT
jgi:D-xylose transport system ATP-binding protein